MATVLKHGPLSFSYHLYDIRQWSAERWVESDNPDDHILAILGGTPDARRLVQRVLERVSSLPPADRDSALAFVAVFAGLRSFETIVKEEIEAMPVVIDWKKNEILREVIEEGREEGRVQGIEEGLVRGLRRGLLTSLSIKFDRLPGWVEERIQVASSAQLDEWMAKVVTADRIEDVIQPE